ncbi:MAG TPA: bifunctional diguanylate cyclase/phosphodiesterase [Telluria sp.]|nr:bifunctional diguanylate cyclase/phosphodiesterase [Telluria sp.]
MGFLQNQSGEQGLISAILFLASGISLYTAVQALMFARTGHRRTLHLYFAAMGLAITLLFLVDSRYYAAATIDEAARLLQWRVALVLLFYPALFGFLAIYTGQRRYRLPLLLLAGSVACLIAVNFAMPYSLRFDSLQPVVQQPMPGGAHLQLYSGDISGWNIASRLITFSVLLWGLARTYRLFLDGLRRRALLLGAALATLLLSSAVSFLIDLGVFNFIYLGGFAYFGLILFVSFSIGLDLHGMNRALTATSEKLQHQIEVHEKTEEYIRQLAFYDSLTGLPNRAKLEEVLEALLVRQVDGFKEGALVMIGLDDFKTINNVLGHDVGDTVLKLVAERLGTLKVPGALLTRFSGDEFVLLVPDLGFEARPADMTACDLARRCLDVFSRPFEFDSRILELEACAGISVFPYPSATDNKPVQCAELALNRAKSQGRGSMQLYESGMQAELADRLQLERDMRSGMGKDEFQVYYQPQVDLFGKVVGAEALLRWNHPERGFISPAVFISIAEKSGLIRPLGDWVLQQVCEQINVWAVKAPAFQGHLAVNVSNWQLTQPGFEERIEQILTDSGVDPSRLTLEITESAFINDLDDAIARMNTIRALGLRFSIDDFGTGFASLSYLRRLPVQELKIDQVFVKNLGTDQADTHLVETIVSIAHHMGMQVVAEGVENEGQRSALRELNIWALQGYHIASPMDRDRFLTWINQHCKQPLASAQAKG